VKSIYLPVMVICCHKRVIPFSPNDFNSDFRSNTWHLVCSYASLPKMQVTHLLDCRGYFHALSPLKKHRAFLGWLAPYIWDFTKMECSVSTIGPLKIGELLVEAKNWKNADGLRLRRYLVKQNPETIFDESQFRSAWESLFKYNRFPEDDWGSVFYFDK
jgi:hypothetical protein